MVTKISSRDIKSIVKQVKQLKYLVMADICLRFLFNCGYDVPFTDKQLEKLIKKYYEKK